MFGPRLDTVDLVLPKVSLYTRRVLYDTDCLFLFDRCNSHLNVSHALIMVYATKEGHVPLTFSAFTFDLEG